MKAIQEAALSWESPGKTGLLMKTVRRDDDRGHFLGLIAFERLISTGIHQHLGTAFSYMLSGGLTDHSGTAKTGEVGINFLGSTHDAIAYQPSLMVSRLEGPVVYGPDISHSLHAGARHEQIVNTHPDMPPDCNIALEAIRPSATWLPGVSRRLLFDYLPTRDRRRLVDFTMLPGAAVPRHRLGGAVDLYVIAGDLTVRSRDACVVTSGGFVVLDPDEELTFSSRYGAHLLAWAEGPSAWVEDTKGPELYGFDASYSSPLGSNR